MDNPDQTSGEQHDPYAEANAAMRESLAALAAGSDLDTFIGHLLSAIERHTRGRCAALFLHDPAVRTLRMRWATMRGVAVDIPTDPLFEVWRRDVPEDLTPAWRLICESATPLFENDLRDPNTWPFSIPWHESLGHRAFVCVPLLAGGRCLGFLSVTFDRPAVDLNHTLVELTQALAQHATLALELSRLADASRDAAIAREREAAAEGRAVELTKANEVLRGSIAALARAPALDRVLGELLQQAAALSQADFLYFWRFDPVADTLSLEYGVAEGRPHEGWSAPAPEYFREPTPAAATPGWAELLQTRALTLYEPVDAGDGRLCPAIAEFVRPQGIKVLANVALVAGDRPFGYLGLAFRRTDALTP
ncbi:MAG: GAF domain-containing protein, partial [Pseudonocardia sp.]|nr:GAF domain-containing protein [Pseudonocardia sp.]